MRKWLDERVESLISDPKAEALEVANGGMDLSPRMQLLVALRYPLGYLNIREEQNVQTETQGLYEGPQAIA